MRAALFAGVFLVAATSVAAATGTAERSASSAAADTQAHSPPPLEAYGRLPTLSGLTLSPDGKTIAFVQGDEPNRVVVVEEIGAPKPRSMLRVKDLKLRSLEWADDTNLIITTSVTTVPVGLIGRRGEFFTAQYLDTKTNSLHRLLSKAITDRTLNVVAGTPESRDIDGHTVLFVPGIYYPDEHGSFGLFRQDLTSGETRMVSHDGETHGEDWLVDNTGNIVAESDYFESDQRWVLKLYRKGNSSDAIDVSAPIEGPDVQGLSEDGSAIIVRLPQTEDVPRYEQVSLRDGTTSPWQHPGLEPEYLIKDTRTGRVIGAPHPTDASDYVFFENRPDIVWQSVKAAFRDATNVDLITWSKDWSKVIVEVFGPRYGAGYFFVDMTTHQATPIASLYDRVDEVSPRTWIGYPAADGRMIYAYLTVPMNREAKNLPLVVLPHGGPHARDEPGFDWLSQAIASRGYAVLQPQFRGSDGFGKELLWAGFGEFGRKMQTDLSDGVHALAAKGLIDPKRVCIVGASYGGYAALAGATLDTGVYRCAVSDAGISDLHELLVHWNWPHNTLDDRGNRFWDRFLAVQDPYDPKLDAISPIKHIDGVSIPILLIHGRDDTVVPFSQSEHMAEALKAAGKQVEFVELSGEDHWLSRSATRLQMLQATIRFLEAHNPPN
jgi:dipeptidyl aminopeptidase/acylaminoacyl peptidase